jgi:PAS domain S-box-containing protein
MATAKVTPTGVERRMRPEDVIMSRTDPRGLITDCNEVFVDFSGYSLAELKGAPHSIIRHPDMPRAVFKLMWQEIQAQREAFLFVKNLAKDGRHYWVVAQVLPEIARGEITGYLSFRRCPSRRAVDTFELLYQKLVYEERRLGGDAGMEASFKILTGAFTAMGKLYDSLIYDEPAA